MAFGSFVANRLRGYREHMRDLGLRQRASFLFARVRLVGEMVEKRDVLRDARREFNAFRVHESNRRALLGYHPETLRGRATGIEIFATASHTEHTAKVASDRWSALVGAQVPVHRLSSKNIVDALRDDQVTEIARLLAARLRDAQGT